MKTIRFLILVYLSNSAFSQSRSLFKTWINENNEALIITDSVVFSDVAHGGLLKSDYRISNDTLFLIEYQWADTKQFPSETDYHILKLSADSLLLIERKKWLGEYTGERETLIFVDSSKVKSRISNFSKFLVQVSHLSSAKIRLKLEIDITGNVYFWDELKTPAYYHHKLEKKQLDSLTMLITRSRVENLSVNNLELVPIDNPGYIFTLTYNNEVIRRTTTDPPYFNWALFDYLYVLKTLVVKNENAIKGHTFIE